MPVLAQPSPPPSSAEKRAQPPHAPQESIQDQVIRIVAEQLGIPVANAKPSAELIKDLGADSLDIVELVMALEEHFEAIEIADEDYCKSGLKVADLVALVITKSTQTSRRPRARDQVK